MSGEHSDAGSLLFARIAALALCCCALLVYDGAAHEIRLMRSVAMPDDTPLNTLPADALFTLALTSEDEAQAWSAIVMALGVDSFLLDCSSFPNLTTLELLVHEVLPVVTKATA